MHGGGKRERHRKREKRVQFDGLTARFITKQKKKGFFSLLFKTFNQALIEKPFSHGHDVKAVVWSVSGPGEAAE